MTSAALITHSRVRQFTKLAIFLLLLISEQAQADFRKALDALQRIDGKIMMNEVRDAIEKRNYDGISLFVNTLSARYRDEALYVKQKTGDNFYLNSGKETYHLLLGKEQIPELLSLLEKAAPSDPEIQFSTALQILRIKSGAPQRAPNYPDGFLESFAELGSKQAVHLRAFQSLNGKYKSSLLEEFEWIQKSAKLGSPSSSDRLALIYSGKLPYPQHPDRPFFSIIPVNNDLAIFWLRKAATHPHSETMITCMLADKYLNDEQHRAPKQAYLWYLETYFSNYGANDCAIDGLKNMSITGQMDIIDAGLATAFRESEKTAREHLNKLRVRHERPDDLAISQDENLEYKPIYSVSEDRYLLEIYANGRVVFEGRGANYIQGADEWHIPSNRVKEFMSRLAETGFFEASRHNTESVLCDTGESWRHGYVSTVKTHRNYVLEYATIRHTFSTPSLAKIFKLQETFVPTQHLRCGSSREDNDYKNCVAEDEWNFSKAEQALSK